MNRVIFTLILLVGYAHATLYQAGKGGCPTFANAVQSQINVTHAEYPADWRIIVACTDGEWNSILTHFGFEGVSNYAFSWRDAHRLTVIRGAEFSKLTDAQQRFVILHELGHIVMQSASEDVADDYARARMK